jgi:hypothetical protein
VAGHAPFDTCFKFLHLNHLPVGLTGQMAEGLASDVVHQAAGGETSGVSCRLDGGVEVVL